MSDFKYTKYKTFEARKAECAAVMKKYPSRIPVVCELLGGDIGKSKFLIPASYTLSAFVLFMRKRIKLDATDGIYVLINGKIPIATKDMGCIYEESKDTDGYLYILLCKENTFG